MAILPPNGGPTTGTAIVNGHVSVSSPLKGNTERIQIVDEEKKFTLVFRTLCHTPENQTIVLTEC